MFSKSVDDTSSGSRRRVWSIVQRFTVLYVISTFALLAVAVGLLYWVLHRSLDARDHALVASKARVLTLLLGEQPLRLDLLANEVEHEAASGPLRYYLRVTDADGSVLAETPDMAGILPANVFPPPLPALPESVNRDSGGFLHRGRFLLLSLQPEWGVGSHGRYGLHVALDISNDLALLANYRGKLVTTVALTLGLSALVGAWLARKGIRPIVAMTRQARQVSASHMMERIPVSQGPSELAELAGAFNAMLDRLEESFERLSRFSGDLAHELRTPINTLRGEAEVALSRSRTVEDYQEILGSSLEELDRMSRMIDEMLFIARTDNPRVALHATSFNVRDEAEAVREFYEPLAGEHCVTIECEGEGTLKGDSMLVRRALSNLVANGIRHTPEGGRLKIRVEPRADKSVEVIVQDSGEGIPFEEQPRVFDRFYRAADVRAAGQGGAGLGLAIVQSIMRLHGGTASLKSTPGQGTQVFLRFPRQP